MIKPKPYRLKCPNCGYSRVVAPKSDVLSTEDIMQMDRECPKCAETMNKMELNFIKSVLGMLLGR